MKNKILAITGSFLPYNDTVTLLAYKHLRKTNLDVDVIALKTKDDNIIKQDYFNDINSKRFNIIYSKDYDKTVCSMGNKNVILGIYNIICYTIKAIKLYKTHKYKYIYTSSLPGFTHLSGYFIKKYCKDVVWIASFSDPIYKSPYKYDKQTFKEYSLIEKIGFLVYITIYMNPIYEKLTMKHADKLIFICDKQKEFMINNHIKLDTNILNNKSIIIPLNYIKDWSLYNNLIDNNTITNNDKKVLVHMGRIYGLRDFTYFIKALHRVNIEVNNLKDRLVIHQYGEFLDRYKIMIKEYDLEELFVVKDKVDYGTACNEMKNADGLILIDTILDDSYKIQPYLPSKYLEYQLLNKPMVVSCAKNSPIAEYLNITKDIEENVYQDLINILNGINEHTITSALENNDIPDILD